MRRITMLVVCTLALAVCVGSAAAQEPADTLKIDYYSGAGSTPDGTLRITNPGTAGGGLCASIFVFDSYQELQACCSCYISPDGLITLSVNTDLLGNTLTGVEPVTGAIKIVSSALKAPLTCPYYPSSLTPTAGLRAWATHLQPGGVTTETASQDATLSAAEVKRLQAECFGIQLDGSGKGQCYCPYEGTL
jgi:hypothetical protein